MNDVVATLTAARELLSDPVRWTKGRMARDAAGERAYSRSPEAVCWCAAGALNKVSSAWGVQEAQGILFASVSGKGIAAFNDDPTTTHADILAAFDRAIAAAKAEAGGQSAGGPDQDGQQ